MTTHLIMSRAEGLCSWVATQTTQDRSPKALGYHKYYTTQVASVCLYVSLNHPRTTELISIQLCKIIAYTPGSDIGLL